MSVTINARGTSVPYFTIGKNGATIYQGKFDPRPTYTPKNGDIWIDTEDSIIKIWVQTGSPETGQWVVATGLSGYSGISGYSGQNGNSGYSGISGYSGLSTSIIASPTAPLNPIDNQLWYDTDNGKTYIYYDDGVSKQWVLFSDPTESTSGFSGYSGVGLSGFSGYSGLGFSGYSGISGVSGYSGISGFSGAPLSWTTITGNLTAVPQGQYICNTASGSFTLTLPSTPTLGDIVVITDGSNFALNPLYVNANGSTFEGEDITLVVDTSYILVNFIYDGSTWQIAATAGPKGPIGDSGYSGYSGAMGNNGTSGYSGISGFSGYTPALERQSAWVAPYQYCGTAPYGSLLTQPVWTIDRIEVASDGSVTVTTATNVAWIDYATATYT